MEEEIEKTIKKDNIDHLFKRLILMVDDLSKNVASFNQGRDLPARKLGVKLHKISSFSREFAAIIRRIRKHRKNVKNINS
jgi:hypothetical protein